MKVLLAEDDLLPRRLVESALTEWGYEVVVVTRGDEALKALEAPAVPRLAILPSWTAKYASATASAPTAGRRK
jgi:DNA-binding response OmpR family regulator